MSGSPIFFFIHIHSTHSAHVYCTIEFGKNKAGEREISLQHWRIMDARKTKRAHVGAYICTGAMCESGEITREKIVYVYANVLQRRRRRRICICAHGDGVIRESQQRQPRGWKCTGKLRARFKTICALAGCWFFRPR